ncbi:MAG: prepilin-type N-terminal cleavage/methylation domain-containing protein, partial [Dysgonamonadaceae bacterium]|nr:prepilin-type N-terminal cleavage/methylation domain-containing protein [Dysgonamonadaceae bacterium]
MKNKFSKQGFTLIELLGALIVVIIVIAIAIPLISNIKEIVRREAFRATAHSIADAGRLLIANENESQGYQEFYYQDGKEYNADGWKLDYSGTGPRTGVVVINEKNKVVLAIHNGTYCATKSADTNTVTVTKTKP